MALQLNAIAIPYVPRDPQIRGMTLVTHNSINNVRVTVIQSPNGISDVFQAAVKKVIYALQSLSPICLIIEKTKTETWCVENIELPTKCKKIRTCSKQELQKKNIESNELLQLPSNEELQAALNTLPSVLKNFFEIVRSIVCQYPFLPEEEAEDAKNKKLPEEEKDLKEVRERLDISDFLKEIIEFEGFSDENLNDETLAERSILISHVTLAAIFIYFKKNAKKDEILKRCNESQEVQFEHFNVASDAGLFIKEFIKQLNSPCKVKRKEKQFCIKTELLLGVPEGKSWTIANVPEQWRPVAKSCEKVLACTPAKMCKKLRQLFPSFFKSDHEVLEETGKLNAQEKIFYTTVMRGLCLAFFPENPQVAAALKVMKLSNILEELSKFDENLSEVSKKAFQESPFIRNQVLLITKEYFPYTFKSYSNIINDPNQTNWTDQKIIDINEAHFLNLAQDPM